MSSDACAISGLVKRFGATTAVDGLSFRVPPGMLYAFLGPNGAGKTTTLRMIAGFETPSCGRIGIDGRDVTAVPVERRGIAMVFQSYALFPHLTVFENVAFGLRLRKVPAAETARRLAIAWGVHPIVTKDASDVDDMSFRAAKFAVREKFAAVGDRIIVVAGLPFGTPGATNLVRLTFITREHAEKA